MGKKINVSISRGRRGGVTRSHSHIKINAKGKTWRLQPAWQVSYVVWIRSRSKGSKRQKGRGF